MHFCQLKEKYYDNKVLENLINNIDKAKIYIDISWINLFGKRTLKVFEVQGIMREFFIRLLKLNLNLFIHFISDIAKEQRLVGPESEKSENYYNFQIIKDKGNDDIQAFFYLEKDFYYRSDKGFQVYKFKIKCPVVSKNFLVEIVNECEKFFKRYQEFMHLIQHLSEFLNFIEKKESEFFMLHYLFFNDFHIGVKVIGPNHISIIFFTDGSNGALKSTQCNFSDESEIKKYAKQIIPIDDKLIFNSLKINSEIIYWIFVYILVFYLSKDRFNFIISEGFISKAEFERPNFSIRKYSGVMSESSMLKSKNIWHRIFLKIKDRCFPEPIQKCLHLKNFKGKFISLEPTLKFDTMELKIRFNENDLLSFAIQKRGNAIHAEIILYGAAIENNFYLKAKNFDDFEQDISEILKEIGVISNINEFNFLKKFLNIYKLV